MADPSISLNDPTALSRMGQLEVVARQLVEGSMIGQHDSPFKGSSVEFVEHRQYTTGDEIRHIDWRAYGKTGRYYIKEFEEETNLHAYVVVDASGSMAYGSSTATKFEYARVLASALGYLFSSQRDSVGLITFDDAIRDRIEPSTNPKKQQLIYSTLSSRKPGGETSLGQCIQQILPTLKRRSLVIILSDFFDDPEQLQTALQSFRRHRHEVILIQIIAPEEADFPFDKPTQFRSLEQAGVKILVDPHRLRKVYLEQFQQFQKRLKEMAGTCGFDLAQLKTSDPFQIAIGRYLDWRKRRGKQGNR
ncbi:DUF58 domain-containing protein [Planctomicrobium sp. SH527]|uniref:DUF58 domain-containing protein n=1 Tax=Planctomicrobium sp. SH527 TaxID=3448123 RepID=UPI003F5CB4A9